MNTPIHYARWSNIMETRDPSETLYVHAGGSTNDFDMDAVESDYEEAIGKILPGTMLLWGADFVADLDDPEVDEAHTENGPVWACHLRTRIKDIDLDAIFEARRLLAHTKYKVRYVDESILGYAGIAHDSTGGWVLEEDDEWIRDLAIVSGHRCEVRDAVAASLDVEACDVDLFPTGGIVCSPTDPHQAFTTCLDWDVTVSGPPRTTPAIRLPDYLWEALKTKAEQRSETLPEMIVEALEMYAQAK